MKRKLLRMRCAKLCAVLGAAGKMRLVLPVIAILLGVGGSIQCASATDFQLNDFVEITRDKVQSSIPNLVLAYPDGRFFTTGFTSLRGAWQFIRVESTDSCEEEICPTVVSYDKADWKVLLKAGKRITGSTNYVNGEFTQCNLSGKDGSIISIKLSADGKFIQLIQ